MTALDVRIEGVGTDLLAAYRASGMERGHVGEAAIRWAFAGNDQAFAVARHEGRIAGISAYIRTRMRFGDMIGEGYQAVDSFTMEDMRGRGIFSLLARAYDAHVRDRGGDLVWGFPNDNAAHAWFERLGWRKFGQVPFMVKPLRAGYLLRKLGLPGDFPLASGRDQNIRPVESVGSWADVLWDRHGHGIGCATIRDAAYLRHRLFDGPHADQYRIVAVPDLSRPALVATRMAHKHGGHIAYLMEAMGGAADLREVLTSEMARLRDLGVELVLAWCHPWAPTYRTLRQAGFLPLPERMRPIRIWFGANPHGEGSAPAFDPRNWYLSYLDSDTV